MKILDDFSDAVGLDISRGDFSEAIVKLANVVSEVFADDRATAKVFSSPRLDALCESLGLATLERLGVSPMHLEGVGNSPLVIVATELHASGGHTRVIEDFVNGSVGQGGAVILVTNLFNRPADSYLDKRVFRADAKIIVAPQAGHDFGGKLHWLQSMLKQLAPHRLYFFNHHQDSIAVAAMVVADPEKSFFIHHGDHNLCLGVHSFHTTHVDLHNIGFFNCRENLGVEGNLYWPLVAEDLGARDESAFLQEGVFTTASCGAAHKYLGRYPFSYVDLVPSIIESSKGRHVHFGPLPEDSVGKIRKQLATKNIFQERFVHVPWVPSLWKALGEYKVDCYLTSFPLGGGKASIEAMGSGTPVIVHTHLKSNLLGGADLVYPEARAWHKPEKLLSMLAGIGKAELVRESHLARNHYLRHYSPGILEHCLLLGRQTAEKGPVPVPLMRKVEPLQAFWSESL